MPYVTHHNNNINLIFIHCFVPKLLGRGGGGGGGRYRVVMTTFTAKIQVRSLVKVVNPLTCAYCMRMRALDTSSRVLNFRSDHHVMLQ